MGKPLKFHQPCPLEGCGSHDAVTIYEDGTGFFFSCKGFIKPSEFKMEIPKVPLPKIPKKNTDSFRTVYTVDSINKLRSLQIPDRKISKQVCEFFGVKASFKDDGSVASYFYPYGDDAYKQRELPKNFTWIGKSSGLFGKERFSGGGKRLIITEGEVDALSIAEASMFKYSKIYPVVSLSSSVMTKSLIEEREWIRSFGEVIIFFDDDDAGKKATEEAIKIIGIDKVKIPRLIENDANDILVKHGPQAVMQCIFDAMPHIPSGIITKEALWEAVVEYNNKTSIEYPEFLEGVNKKTKGARLGEIALFVSGTSCLGFGTPVLMYDGSIKNIEDILIGDQVMGDDSTPRNVLALSRGSEQLYRVSLNDGTSFVCNESHIHSVVNNDSRGRWGLSKNEIVDVTIKDYIKWSDKRKHLSKSFKANALEFTNNHTLILHPYILGAWLGDGYSDSGRFSASDGSLEILEKFEKLDQSVVKNKTEFSWGLPKLANKLREIGVLDNKHIPEIYLTASISQRMELLAGLLDTDGCALKDGRYEFSQKDEKLTDSFIRLSRSLGFKASKSKQVGNRFGNCYRVWISGPHISEIPVAISYKKIPYKEYRTDQRRSETHLEKLNIGDFYGFELDNNKRFVLGNFTVTHNCGKSTIMREIMLSMRKKTNERIGVVSLEESPAETARKLAGMQLNLNPANEEIDLETLKVGFDEVFSTDGFIILDHQGGMKDDKIFDKLEYMSLSGCKYIIIDHLTILVSEGTEDLTGNEAIDKTMNDLLRFVKRHNVWIGLVSHLRKTTNTGKAFEEGRMPNLDDIKGCLAYDTKVLSSTGKEVLVQDIAVGDMLMGDDGTARKVLQLFRGEQNMYRINTKTTKDSFICNEDHILTLSRNNIIFDIKVSDFLKQTPFFQERCKQHYSSGYELPARPLIIPPYSLGAWLGDGSKSAFRIMDASNLGIAVRVASELNATLKAPTNVNREYFNFTTNIHGDMLHRLKILNLYENKHIPEDYVLNTKEVRLNLLAGLIDTDGSYSPKDNAYYFYQKDLKLAETVKKIARSLGFYSNLRTQKISGGYSSKGSNICVVTISGNIERIPTQKAIKLSLADRYTNPLKRGITIEKLGIQKYYGFKLDGNGRFLLGNHIITHNSGSIKQVSFDIIAFARNLMEENEVRRNTIDMAVLKCRYTGLTGSVSGAYYNNLTGRFNKIEGFQKVNEFG